MTIRHNLFLRASSFLLLLSCIATAAFSQGRVNKYTITGQNQTWTDLTTSGGTLVYGGELHYYNYTTTSFPFAFNYDMTTITAGSTLYLEGGYVSFNATPVYVNSAGLGSSSYPGVIAFFGGPYMCEGTYTNHGGSYPSYYGIYTQVTGSAPNRVFTVQEQNIHSQGEAGYQYGGGFTYMSSVQVKFFETSGVIEFLYAKHSTNICHYNYYTQSIGLNGFTTNGFQSLTYASNTYTTPATDIIFTPPPPPQELSLNTTPVTNPKTLNFGTTTPQNPITKCVTATNTGASGTTLHVTGFGITGASAFTVASGPAIGTGIAAGNSVQYCIQFQPFSNGGQSATFTLQTDGVDSGTQSVSLNGVGAVPLVSYSATSMFRGVNTEVDSTSGVQYLYVHSIGGGPLTVNSAFFIGLDARAYFFTHLPQSSIPVGGVDSIGIRFSPDLEGVPDAKLVVNTSAVNIPSDTVQMFGVGILPHLSLSSPLPNVLSNQDHLMVVNFDSVKLGYDSCLSVVLTNPGSDTLDIVQNYLSSMDFDFSLTPFTGAADTILPPGTSATMQVCFQPIQRGYRTATVAIRTNIPVTQQNPAMDTSRFEIQFVGHGVPVGMLSAGGPNNGNVPVGTQMCVMDTLYNDGEADMQVTGLSITGPNASVFKATTTPPPTFTIPAGGHALVDVCATPDMMGTETATLTATGTSGGTPVQATLSLMVNGTSINDTVIVPMFANTCVGSSDTEIVTITNTGNVTEQYQLAPGGTGAFAVLTPNTSGNVPGDSSTTFKVVFTPTMGGSQNGTLIVTGGKTLGPITITGMGETSPISGDTTGPTTQVGQTSNPFMVPVNNTGSCPWDPGTQVKSSDPEFTYVPGSLTAIPAGGSEQLQFTFAPTSPGNKSTNITFPGAGPSTSISVSINAVASSEDVKMITESNGYLLEQNYPNPIVKGNSTDAILTLPESGNVRLVVIDAKGEIMETVLDQFMTAGSYTVSIDASNLANGAYYYRMTSGDVTLTRQMSIIR